MYIGMRLQCCLYLDEDTTEQLFKEDVTSIEGLKKMYDSDINKFKVSQQQKENLRKWYYKLKYSEIDDGKCEL